MLFFFEKFSLNSNSVTVLRNVIKKNIFDKYYNNEVYHVVNLEDLEDIIMIF